MDDREPDRPRRDERAGERVGGDEAPEEQDAEGKGGPYGNPRHDEEALRKSQEERRPERDDRQGRES